MKIRMKFKSNNNSMTYGRYRSVEEYPTGKANGSHQFSIIFTLRLVVAGEKGSGGLREKRTSAIASSAGLITAKK
jgi:hypothetical protein